MEQREKEILTRHHFYTLFTQKHIYTLYQHTLSLSLKRAHTLA